MHDARSRRFVVAGKVQGVFFRASTAREAQRLGLRGHAVNLPDGRVEVLAVGAAAAIAELHDWLQRGPPAARVDSVTELAVGDSVEAAPGFRTG
ncbi:MAG: acylphosphatase [Gammaproteobacteria bacterium]|nr:acylphosphatase [Gammaproteobacteria bacterium]